MYRERLHFKIIQFCKLVNEKKSYKLCYMLSVKNSSLFGSSCIFGIYDTVNCFICVRKTVHR